MNTSRQGAVPFLFGELLVAHGFTTRYGGESQGAYESLNLGLSSGDEAAVVEQNRDLLLNHLGFERSDVCAFHQVHGDTVLDGAPGWFTQEADAAVTNDPNRLLVVSMADCLPVLFHDFATGAVGAAHCGWRGTVAGLAAKVVRRMGEEFGSRPEELMIQFGPAVEGECYQVGTEVIEQFVQAQFPEHVYWRDAEVDKWRLDIKAANRWSLERAGVLSENIVDPGFCTHCMPHMFYSYRRDNGVTGRHWAFVSPRLHLR